MAVEDGAGGGVCEGARAGAGFDEVRAGGDAQALQDVAVVGGVDYLGAVGEADGPGFRGGLEEVGEAGAGDDGGLHGCGLILGSLAFVLGIAFSLASFGSRSGVDF